MTDSTIKQRVQDDMKTAMKSGDKSRLSAIRLILAAIKQREIDERITLSDDQILVLLDKMIKQRNESAAQFEKGKRMDLFEKENLEIQVIQTYLPTPLSATEIETLIEQAIQQTGATNVKEMGKVMGVIKPKIQGRADIKAVSEKIKSRLCTE